MSIGRVPGATGIQPSIVTAKGDLIVATASGSVTNQAVGSNNQVLTADSAQADGVKWANGSAATLTTTGDLLYASSANTPARLAIGSTSQVLTVSGGIPAWATLSSTPTAVGAQALRTSTQGISTSTNVAISWSSAPTNTDSIWSSGSATRFTVPSGKGGKWFFNVNVVCNNVSGQFTIKFYKNGSLISGNELTFVTSSTNITGGSLSAFLTLAAADYLEAFVFSTGPNEVVGNATSASFFYVGA